MRPERGESMGFVRIRGSMEEVDSLPFTSSEQPWGGIREERRSWWEPEDPEESKNLRELQPVDQLKRPRGDKDLVSFCCRRKSLCGSLLVVMFTGSHHNYSVMPLIGTVARRPPVCGRYGDGRCWQMLLWEPVLPVQEC